MDDIANDVLRVAKSVIAHENIVVLNGNTYPIRQSIKQDGWNWSSRYRQWEKRIDDTMLARLRAKDFGAVEEIRGNKKGCILELFPTHEQLWVSKNYTTHTIQHMGCDACGDHVPATKTPRGWLCDDCKAGN